MVPELNYFKELLPKAATVFVGNKVDLLQPKERYDAEEALAAHTILFASAKTGLGVEDMFLTLGLRMVP
jgi:50S ribosomal subunit-associated GTPase HflX